MLELMLFVFIGFIALVFSFNYLKKTIILKKKEEQAIDLLFHLSLEVKNKSLLRALNELKNKGFNFIEEDFITALNKARKGMSLTHALNNLKNKYHESIIIRKTIDFIILGLNSGVNLSNLFKQAANNMLKSKQLLMERNSSLVIQKYSLILISMFLLPLILSMTLKITSKLDLSLLKLIDVSVNLLEKKEVMNTIKSSITIYLIEFSFISSYFLSLIEQNKHKTLFYGILFSLSSIIVFFVV